MTRRRTGEPAPDLHEGAKLERRAQTGFNAAVVLLAAAGLVSNISLYAYQRADRSRAQALEVLSAVDRLVQVVVDGETSARGFVVTNDEAFLEPGKASRQLAPEVLARLEALTADHAAQHARVERLAPLVRAKLDWVNHVADVRRTRGFEAARVLVASSQGRNLMDQIRDLSEELSREELALLKQRDAAAHRHGRAAQFVTIVGGVLAVLVLMRTLFAAPEGKQAAPPSSRRTARTPE